MENTTNPSTTESVETINLLLSSANWSVIACIVPSCTVCIDWADTELELAFTEFGTVSGLADDGVDCLAGDYAEVL